MKRYWTALAAAVVVGALTLLIMHARQPPTGNAVAPVFHASDVALLGVTGRPQLVEFFHPG